MSAWLKLAEHNSWESISYYDKGDASKARVSLCVGQRCAVRFPDGHFEGVELSSRKNTVSVSDHGREYLAESERFGFVALFHGVQVWVPITEVVVNLEVMR